MIDMKRRWLWNEMNIEHSFGSTSTSPTDHVLSTTPHTAHIPAQHYHAPPSPTLPTHTVGRGRVSIVRESSHGRRDDIGRSDAPFDGGDSAVEGGAVGLCEWRGVTRDDERRDDTEGGATGGEAADDDSVHRVSQT